MRTTSQRELRNHISRILREVESGDTIRVTVDGRPVADLVPVHGNRRTFVPASAVRHILRDAPLDPAFAADVDSILSETTEAL